MNYYDSRSFGANETLVRVAALPFTPWFFIDKKNESNPGETSGIFAEVLQLLSLKINFRFSLTFKEGYASWGWKDDNGSWNGILGRLQRNEEDIFLGPVTLSTEKFEDFHFGEAIMYSETIILASKGKAGSNTFFAFLFKIDPLIAQATAACFLLLILSSSLDDTAVGFTARIRIYFWMYLATLVDQGVPRKPFSRRRQFLFGIWILCVLVLLTAVTGQFKAALAVREDIDVIHTVQDVVNKKHLIPMFLAKSYFENIFKNSSLESYKEIHRRAYENRRLSLLSIQQSMTTDVYQKIKDGASVYIGDLVFVKYMLPKVCKYLKGDRQFYIADQVLSPIIYAPIVSGDFPEELLKKINQRTRWMKECGLIMKWTDKYNKDFWTCTGKRNQTNDTSLNIKHLSSVVLLLLSLHGFSFCVAIHEVLWFYKTRTS